MLNPLAQELNNTLSGTTAGALLSELGTRIYFPKGIIAQSAEAKKLGKTANATIGMTVIGGKPAILPSVQSCAPGLSSAELAAYAPTAGNPDLREQWKNKIIEKNPALSGVPFSLPVVVPGLTAGIAILADLFLEEDKPLLAGDPSWDNYSLIVETRRNAPFHQFSMFSNGAFNTAAFEQAVRTEAATGTVRVLLNFPQNPSGYSPTAAEAAAICRCIRQTAEQGTKVLVWCDDAYFGLNFEDSIEKQSLFAHLAGMHENVLAVKIDGPTKEDYVWGFRCGFLTFGCKGMTEAQYDALVKKLMGLIRSSVSCSSTPAQSIMLHAFKSPSLEAEKQAFRAILEKRYRIVRHFVDTHTSTALQALPFNSGYFMSFHLTSISAEKLRLTLLNERGIGTIAIDDSTLRVAFSSLDEDKIEMVYSAIYECAETLSRC
jgi:aspartate/methionine/tyrosine aminotransferase